MTFDVLYGIELDRELGTADRDQRFTTARRKAAINAGQLEFVKRTECLQRQASVTLVDATQEVDLEASVSDFGWIAAQGISIAITSGTTTRYLEGDDLHVTTVETLNTECAGWRAESAGTPRYVYIRREGGALNLGLHPKPAITAGDTWVALVPYVVVPTDLSADADVPFTVSSNAIASLRPWHRALVYFAAFDLEKLRKDTGRQQAAFQLFELEVQRYLQTMKPKGGSRVRFARNYRAMQTWNEMVAQRYWNPRT